MTFTLSSFFRRDHDVVPKADVSSGIQAVARTTDGTPRHTRPKMITLIEDLPSYTRVLTAKGGPVALDASDYGSVALLETQNREVLVVWTGEKSHAQIMRFAQMGLADLDYRLTGRYHAPSDLIFLLHEHAPKNVSANGKDKVTDLTDTAMTQRFDAIVGEAVRREASDIHFRFRRGGVPTNIMFRINGDLSIYSQVSAEVGENLARAMYRLGGKGKTGVELDLNQPQDANIKRSVNVKAADGSRNVKTNLRFGSAPERSGGGDLVLRVIPEENDEAYWPLEKLGYSPAQRNTFERALMAPDGTIALVGTTGSGKSRTLQTMLGMLYAQFGDTRHIMTVEQPVEYVIPGATQIPVPKQEDDSFGGFAKMLRAMMRTDPDIIMVGEVRDEETGETMQNAVQTGHKVLTTLHAKNCVQAVSRFMNLGVEREVLCGQGFINAIAFQYLVQTVCHDCALPIGESGVSSATKLRVLSRVGGRSSHLRFRNLEGCEKCNFTGVTGRTVCAEMFVPEYDVLDFISDGKLTNAWMCWRSKAASKPNGVQGYTAMDHAVDKMCDGIVSPTDVESACGPLDSQISPRDALKWLENRHGARDPIAGARAQPSVRAV